MPIDADAQRVLDLIKEAGRPAYETLSAPEGREMYREARAVFSPDPPEMAALRDLVAAGPHGPIRLRLYRPRGSEAGQALPALVYYHGGGWVIGDLDTHDVICRQIANAAACAVVSVDYRLAPEHKFPAAVDDSIAALRWVAGNAGTLGIDARRLAVGGDSAGGNLAAVVSIDARDHAGPPLRAQILVYPATDMAMRHPSHEKFAEGRLLTRANMLWFTDHYLRSEADRRDWRASPLLADDLSRLPAALVIVAGFDPLHDEGVAFAEALAAAGGKVTLRCFAGQIHGFLTMGRLIRESADAVEAVAANLREAFSA